MHPFALIRLFPMRCSLAPASEKYRWAMCCPDRSAEICHGRTTKNKTAVVCRVGYFLLLLVVALIIIVFKQLKKLKRAQKAIMEASP